MKCPLKETNDTDDYNDSNNRGTAEFLFNLALDPVWPLIIHDSWHEPLPYFWQDLDAYHDDEDREHYYSAAPSGWDDPGDSEVPPPYMRTDSDPHDDYQGPNVNRGDSFVSPAMFVWREGQEKPQKMLACVNTCACMNVLLSDCTAAMGECCVLPFLFKNIYLWSGYW